MNEEEKQLRFLDAQEHPEKYTDEQLDQILQDGEDLAELKRAFMSEKLEHEDIDTEAAWEEFEKSHISKSTHSWLKIAVSFMGIIFITSAVYATAISFGIVSNPFSSDETHVTVIERDSCKSIHAITKKDSLTNSSQTEPRVIYFDNKELSVILTEMAKYYKVDVTFMNNETKSIRLCFDWDQKKTLADNLYILNSFQKININLKGNQLTVE